MATFRFLDLPTSIRDQIYEELLVPPVIKHGDGCISQDAACTNILYATRQIYVEASDAFYSKNLFTMICRNGGESYEVLDDLDRDKLRILYDVKDASKIAQCKRFAMSMEIITISQLCKATSTPLYVVSAAALPYFASGIIGEYKFVTGTGTVRMKIENIFRYTTLKFSELVFGGFLSAERLPIFLTLQIEGPIEPSYKRSMMQNCVQQKAYGKEELGCASYEMGIRCYRDRVWFRMRMEREKGSGMHKEIPEPQIHELPRLMLRMYDIFWDYHKYREREFGHTCGTAHCIFNAIGDTFTVLVHGYFLAADRDPEKGADNHIQALRAAEDGLKYLNRDDRLMFPRAFVGAFATVEETENAIRAVNSRKATLSRKAAEACAKLGYPMEAEQYMADFQAYKPIRFVPTKEHMVKISNRAWPPVPGLVIKPILWRKDDRRFWSRVRSSSF